MLVVVAIVGGAIFSTVQSESPHAVSGFAGSNVQVSEFGVSVDDELSLNLNDATGNGAEISEINVSDPNTGQYIWKEVTSNNWVSVSEDQVFDLPNVTQSESPNTLNVDIIYNTGALENLQVSGSISGDLELQETTELHADEESDLQILDLNPLDPVEENDELTVVVELENDGSSLEGQEVVLEVDDNQDGSYQHEDTQTVNMEEDEIKTVNLNYASGDDSPGVTVKPEAGDSSETEDASITTATQYSTDFSEYSSTLSLMDDWDENYESDQQGGWYLETETETLGDSYIEYSGSGGGTQALLWEDLGTNQDVEILYLTRFKDELDEPTSTGLLRSEQGGEFDSPVFYSISFVSTFADRLESTAHIGGMNSNFGAYNGEFVENQWYWVRYRADDNNPEQDNADVRAKVWEKETQEPDDWNIDEVNDDLEGLSGYVGLSTNGPHADFDYFGAAVEGDSAEDKWVELP